MSERSTFRKVVGVIATFGVVWVVAGLYWRFAHRVPTARELALVGIALPLLLMVAFVCVRATLARPAAPRRAVSTAAATLTTATTAAAAQVDAHDDWPTGTLAVLDGALSFPAGMAFGDIHAAARSRDTVGLHPTLKRVDESRIFAADATSISLDDFDEQLLPSGSAASLDDEHWRALMLAAHALDGLLSRHAVATTHDASLPRRARPLALHLLLPARWQQIAPTLAAWVDAHVARQHGASVTLPARTHIVEHPAQALAIVDELNVSLNRDRSTDRHIVLACDSWLGQHSVNALERADRLHGPDCRDGLVPGEGACALLLGLGDREDDGSPPAARIHRVKAAESTPAADQPDETVSQLLEAARTRTVAYGIDMAACALVSDASQRSSQTTEIANAESAWPDDDTSDRCLHLGLANGDSGAALALGAVALAAAHAVRERQPTFAATVAHPHARAVALVTPPLQGETSLEPVAATSVRV
ncbi:hypothetical protein DID96_32930 [Burkholderia sp. Bp8963]|uniref:hypothetical protein n=1 Tax=Burkholderia sp. Bp8963 TaxID=2184547 RepID=UPI000F59E16D|nr:hypothetical protein [Burkholderia sp. Bp8963]RQS61554.1 hypothetical protein DID96_32930 [Burkholderia sp. Bp8963]